MTSAVPIDQPILLGPIEAAAALAEEDIPLARQRTADTIPAAVDAATELGLPVAVKLSSPELVHKSDHGAVMLGLIDQDSVAEACRLLTERAAALRLTGWRFLVQEMVAGSEVEMYLGARRDPAFGPIVLAGAGGRLVELLGEPALRLCPVDRAGAIAMIHESPLGRLADGYRGGAGLDVAELASVVSSLSRLMESRPDIVEVDLNPLVENADGRLCAVDSRVLAIPEGTAYVAATKFSHPDRAAIEALFDPRSVVVLGASEKDPRKPGSRIVGYLRRHGYPGGLSIVHPTAELIQGLPCYPSVASLPDVPDLACIAVPREACSSVLEECGSKGARAAIIFTAGFSEGGDDDGERDLRAIADRHEMALCGPNTIGIVNTARRLHASFSQAQEVEHPLDGRIAIVSQSGALGGSLLSQAWGRGLGIGRFVSVGNQAALSTEDVLLHLAEVADITTVCVLIEGVKDGQALRAALAAATRRLTSVVALKIGTSRVGAEVVRSHTATLAGDTLVFDAVLREGGAVRASSMGELLDIAELIERGCRPGGSRVGIVSTSGGACSLLADSCDASGLAVPELPAHTRAVLEERLPGFSAVRNPVDVTGQVAADPTLLVGALSAVAESGAVDALLVAVTSIADPQAEELAGLIATAALETEIPVIVIWTIDPALARGGLALLREAGVPAFGAPEPAVQALGALAMSQTIGRGPADLAAARDAGEARNA